MSEIDTTNHHQGPLGSQPGQSRTSNIIGSEADVPLGVAWDVNELIHQRVGDKWRGARAASPS